MQKDFWEQRYSEEGWAYGTEPNAWLASQRERFGPGQSALVVGDGEGRNGVWLAQQGVEVVSVDQSAAGLRKAQALAADRGVTIETVCADLTTWDWPRDRFDWVVIIYVHFPPEVRAAIHQRCLQALKPGGEILLEGFTPDQLNYSSGGPPVKAMLYTRDMLLDDFQAGEILDLEECIECLNEGKYHVGEGAIIRLRVRRPG